MASPIHVNLEFTDERAQQSKTKRAASTWAARLASLCVLVVMVSGVSWVVHTAYRALLDSFVAPIILSPDNDLVLEHRRKVMELEVQRSLAQSRAESTEADLAAMEQGEQRLMQLGRLTGQSLSFVNQLTKQQDSSGTIELSTLEQEHQLLRRMFEQQRDTTARAKANFEARLMTRGEYEREVAALNQAELALLENDRALARVEERLGEVELRGNALERRGALLPEQVTRDSQMVQVQIELLRLNAEKRARVAEKRVLDEQIKQIVELQEQLRIRPIFQAIERSLYAAFVPYTQLDGIGGGSTVYRCTWGLYNCRRVGTVSELVPGEVSMPDPWGNQARGQILLLNLDDEKAATAKTLRVRGSEKS